LHIAEVAIDLGRINVGLAQPFDDAKNGIAT
jgi:hypothetical protein